MPEDGKDNSQPNLPNIPKPTIRRSRKVEIDTSQIEKTYKEKYDKMLAEEKSKYETEKQELLKQIETHKKELDDIKLEVKSKVIDENLNNLLGKYKPKDVDVIKSFIKSNYNIDFNENKLIIKKDKETLDNDKFFEGLSKERSYLFEQQIKDGVTISPIANGGNIIQTPINDKALSAEDFYNQLFKK